MTRTHVGPVILTAPMIALAACGPAPEPAAPPPPAATVDVSPPPPPPSQPSANASAEPAARPAPPPSPLAVVATFPSDVALHAIDGAVLVSGEPFGSAADAALWLGEAAAAPNKDGSLSGLPIGVLVGQRLRFPRKLVFQGTSAMSVISGAAGRWPGDAWVLAMGSDGRTGIAEPFRVSEERGYEAKRPSPGHFFVGAARSGAGVLSMQAPTYRFPGTKPAIVDLATGRSPLAFTAASKSECWDADAKQLRQSVAVMPSGFGPTKEGDLLSIGTTCSDRPAVEVWAAGAKTGSVHALTGDAVELGEIAAVVPASDKGAYILASSAVLRWDGAALTRLPLPAAATNAEALAVGPDGALWVATREGLFHQTGAAWDSVALPVAGWVTSLATTEGQLYAVVGRSLLRLGAKPGDPPIFTPGAVPAGGAPITRTMSPPPPAPTPQGDATAAPRKPRLPGPGSAKCAHNVVLLYAFTKVTPDDYDFPLTRKAVKGHTELAGIEFAVVKENGRKFFSGLAPSFDAAKKLQALIAKEVKDSSPQIFCAEPEVVRTLAIDLRTGEVSKK